MNVHSLSNGPALGSHLRRNPPVHGRPPDLQRLFGELPDRGNHAKRHQSIDRRFQNVPALLFRLHQQFVSAIHVSLSPSQRFRVPLLSIK